MINWQDSFIFVNNFVNFIKKQEESATHTLIYQRVCILFKDDFLYELIHHEVLVAQSESI